MADDFSDRVDLFGAPLPATRDKAGRPEHVWTQENSNKINLMFASGHELKDAAIAIGVSVPTLRKHYFAEVQQWRNAKLRLEAKSLSRLNEAAEAGNVAAEKELWKRVEKGQLRQLADRVANPQRPKKEKIGKKAEAKQAAKAVGGKFAPPPPPNPLLN